MSYSVCLPLPGDGTYQKQWDYALSNFQPATLYVLGDKADAPPSNVFTEAVYLATAEELPDVPLVVLAPEKGFYVPGTESLATFDHPEDCIYLFGPDNVPLSSDHLGARTPDVTVFIPTDTADEMFSFVAYAVAVWDRVMKRG